MADFEAVYAELRARMLRAAAGMTADDDSAGGLVLHAPWAHPTKPREPMWFGAVCIGKAYVSYDLPAYSHPELLDSVSSALKKRMQGKSCFNFKAADPALLALRAAGGQARPAVGP